MSKKQSSFFEVRHIENLKDMLQKSVSEFGDHPAFKLKLGENDYKYVSYKEYQKDVNALGTALLSLGLKDKFIAVIGENSYKWCVSYMATVNGVGTIVPLDKELPVDEVEKLLSRSGAAAIVYAGKHLSELKPVFSNLPNLQYIIDMDLEENEGKYLSFDKMIADGNALIEGGDTEYLNAVIDHEKMNMLLFTSGTTDKSKGVMLSHKNICTDMMTVRKLLCADTNDSILSILPLHHTYECTCGFLEMINLGVTISFCEGIRHIAKNMKEIQPTMIMAVPLILEGVYTKVIKTAKKNKKYAKLRIAMAVCSFLHKKLGIDIRRKVFKDVHESLGGRLRLVISGAAALNPKVSKGLRAMGLDIMQGYGLTECSPIVSVNRMDYFDDASAGLPLPDVQVKIDQPDEDGIGEIIVKSDIVMLGYYQDEQATHEVIKDGWFYTGDYGYISKKGFVYISGRKKNVIVTKNGKNIFPEDVELYLNKSDYIAESLVYSVDEEGEDETIVCAQIVPNMEIIQEQFGYSDAASTEVYELMKEEVRKINKKLSIYKKVRRFEIRKDEFEKTTTKKIKRYLEIISLKKFQDSVKSTADAVKGKLDEVKDKLDEVKEDVKGKIGEVKGEVKVKIDEVKEKVAK